MEDVAKGKLQVVVLISDKLDYKNQFESPLVGTG